MRILTAHSLHTSSDEVMVIVITLLGDSTILLLEVLGDG